MAIYRLSMHYQSRREGQNAIRKAAYNSCSMLKVTDHEKADYRRKTGLIHSQMIFAPRQQPVTRQDFWKEVEARERYKTACVSREIQIALPNELEKNDWIDLANEMAQVMIAKFEFPAVDVNLHLPHKGRKKEADEGSENPHIHIQMPDRDQDGKKIRNLYESKTVFFLRKKWEEICNKKLEEAGLKIRISADTIEKQMEDIQKQITQYEKEIETCDAYISKLQEELKNEQRHQQRTSDPDFENIRAYAESLKFRRNDAKVGGGSGNGSRQYTRETERLHERNDSKRGQLDKRDSESIQQHNRNRERMDNELRQTLDETRSRISKKLEELDQAITAYGYHINILRIKENGKQHQHDQQVTQTLNA